jgi:hypothetical protein
MYVKAPYRKCIYSRFPEDEPSGSKHAEDIKIKNLNIKPITPNDL